MNVTIYGQNRRIGKKVNGALVEGFLYRNQLGALTNLYNYVAGDPVNFIDPTGLYFDEATLTPEIRRALSRLEANPEIGWEIQRLAADQNHRISFEPVSWDKVPWGGANMPVTTEGGYCSHVRYNLAEGEGAINGTDGT